MLFVVEGLALIHVFFAMLRFWNWLDLMMSSTTDDLLGENPPVGRDGFLSKPFVGRGLGMGMEVGKEKRRHSIGGGMNRMRGYTLGASQDTLYAFVLLLPWVFHFCTVRRTLRSSCC